MTMYICSVPCRLLFILIKEKGTDVYETLKGLTRKTYVWIAAQAVIGSSLDGPDEFPVGMLGVHFRTGQYTIHC